MGTHSGRFNCAVWPCTPTQAISDLRRNLTVSQGVRTSTPSGQWQEGLPGVPTMLCHLLTAPAGSPSPLSASVSVSPAQDTETVMPTECLCPEQGFRSLRAGHVRKWCLGPASASSLRIPQGFRKALVAPTRVLIWTSHTLSSLWSFALLPTRLSWLRARWEQT